MTSNLRNLALDGGSRYTWPPGRLGSRVSLACMSPRAGGRETRRWAPGYVPDAERDERRWVIVGFP